MNTKIISLFLLYLVTGCLVSCTDEEMMDPNIQPMEGLSVVLTSDVIATKAVADHYTYASADELQINKVHIAFFRLKGGEPDAVIGMKDATFQNGQSNATTTENAPAYRVDNITVKSLKEKVRVLAIANSKYDFSTCKRYADYLAAIESNLDAGNQPTALFTPSDLVKRGGIEFDLGKQDLSQSVEIPLTQLAAKVTLNLVIDLPVIKETEGGVVHSIDKFLSKINKENMNSAQSSSSAITINDNSNKKMGIAYVCKKEHGAKGPFWYNDVECKDNVIVHVGDVTVDSTFTTVRPVLFIPSLEINNVETKSDILIPAEHTATKLLSWNGGKTDNNVAEKFTISFYTYQKKLFDSDTNTEVLHIKLVDAKIINKTEIIKKTYTGASAHAVWTYIPNGGTDESKRIPTTGWNNPDKTYKFIYLEDNVGSATLQPMGAPEYSEIPNSGSMLLKNNIIRVNPKYAVDGSGNQICTDGLIHGNLYEVTATVRSTEVGADLEWEIVSMDKVDVTIPMD